MAETQIYENVIILTDGHETYLFNTDMGDVRTVDFNMSQVYLRSGCRLIECNSRAEVINFTERYKRAPIPDESNWEFFADG